MSITGHLRVLMSRSFLIYGLHTIYMCNPVNERGGRNGWTMLMQRKNKMRSLEEVAVELVRQCPKCKTRIQETAIVDAWNEPAAWSFWGPGQPRYIVCQSAGWTHFRVEVNGRQMHRLAIIKPGYAPPPRLADAPPMVAGKRDEWEGW